MDKKLTLNNIFLKNGINYFCKENDSFKMFLDIAILKLKKGEKAELNWNKKEKAILIWNGKLDIQGNQKKYTLERKSIWDDFLMAIHGSKKESFKIKALEDSEAVIQAKSNEREFPTKLYDKNNCKVFLAGNNYENSVSRRQIINVFNYENAPYSKMVLGEVFAEPGHWSGYPPHKHNQPEIYIYRFDKKVGFGVGFSDDNAIVVRDYQPIFIPGNTMHQNATAPGYQMYFTWMIPHLRNDPWISRNYDKKHEWINSEKKVISRKKIN